MTGGTFDNATKQFNNAIQLNNENYYAHYYLGTLNETLSRDEPAIFSFKSISPDSDLFSEAQMHISYIKNKNGKKEESINIIKKAISIKKNDLKLYRFIASIYEKEENFVEGIKYLKQAIKIEPENEDTLFSLASCMKKHPCSKKA